MFDIHCSSSGVVWDLTCKCVPCRQQIIINDPNGHDPHVKRFLSIIEL